MSGIPRHRKAPPPPPLSEFDLGWLVGFLEGEGSFTANGAGIRVLVKGTDHDTMVRAGALLGANVIGPYHYPEAQLGTKPYWMVALNGRRARGFMASTRALYSERRQQQIAALLGKQLDIPGGSSHDTRELPRGT